MGLKAIFSNSFETVEFGDNNNLLTHYYQADYEKVKNTIIDISKAMPSGSCHNNKSPFNAQSS